MKTIIAILLLVVWSADRGSAQAGRQQCGRFSVVRRGEMAQTINTPDFPLNYPNNAKCTWVIIADVGLQVEIQFGRILTEACCDYIDLRDGNTENSPLITRLRGNITERNYLSTFGAFHITFFSDETETQAGFQMQFQAVEVSDNCGEELQAGNQTQTLSFPSGSATQYPNNSLCFWVITAPPGFQVVLFIQSVITEICCDYIQIRDGADRNSPQFAYVAGRFRPAGSIRLISTNRVLSVRFRSNQAISDRGFRTRFLAASNDVIATLPSINSSAQACGEELQVPRAGHGEFNSPNYPRIHAGNLMCTWNLTAANRSRIRVWFSHVSTEACCDWIIIRDGHERTSPKLGTISGAASDFHNFVSTSNQLSVEFNTNSNINSRGFNAFYEIYQSGSDARHSVCGGRRVADSTLQYIATPNWPMRYTASTTCTWTISARSVGGRVRLHFLGIITEAFFDHITIYAGPSVLSRPIARISGRHFRQYIVTGGASLTVEFVSDRSLARGGFRASYTQILPGGGSNDVE